MSVSSDLVGCAWLTPVGDVHEGGIADISMHCVRRAGGEKAKYIERGFCT